MKYPSITTIKAVTEGQHTTALINGRWVQARPLGFPSWRHRVRATWLVFTGKADALVWDDTHLKEDRG